MKRDLSSIQLKTPIVEREETGVRDTTTSAISGGVFRAIPESSSTANCPSQTQQPNCKLPAQDGGHSQTWLLRWQGSLGLLSQGTNTSVSHHPGPHPTPRCRHRSEARWPQRGHGGGWARRGEEPVGREEPAINTHPGCSPSKLRKKAKLFKLRA